MIRIIYITITMLLLIVLIGKGYPNYMDIHFVGLILAINILSLFLFFFKGESNPSLKKQYLKTSNLFLIGFAIVHFQMYIDLFLGFLSEDNSFLFINKHIAIKSLLISSIALNIYCLGYFSNKERKLKSNNNVFKILDTNILYYFAIASFVLFFVTVDKNYLAGNYGVVEKGDSAGIIGLLFQSSISALLIIKSRNLILQNRGFGISLKTALLYLKKEISLLIIFTLATMISGERNILIFNSLFLFGILSYITKMRLTKIQLFLLLGISTFSITLIGAARRFRDEGTIIQKITLALDNSQEERNYSDSFLNSTRELASSGRTLNIAVDAIDLGVANYTYGLFTFQDIMLIIPSLKGSFINFFEIPSFLTSSPHYLTYINLGPYATWGVGSSCVADTYLDFGILGVLFIYFLYGLYTRKLELSIYNNKIVSFFVLTVALLILSSSIYTARATIIYGLNKLFYILFFIYFVVLINKIKSR
ncbi:O-antigen polysaccharide polymerase Wzy [Capnocytophaga cynodegmi]|uniref:O-antigen polysaccharide polymerase Wzy n=1 Tax=Capnocytophaga cynodegmi TaxID=28189 RepID=UPI001AD0FA1C|nr:O-antigen polysaccharide polymerase Wzy [Capnocytophaga cynodegmi]GIM54973.1 hypothetical protein CAPN005_16200 [Capnocytophaga cynodegmi]